MEDNEIEILFVKRIMKLMEEAYQTILFYNGDNEYRKFQIVKELSSLTAELMKKKDVYERMKSIAESSKVEENNSNIDDKFKTFTMLRNVINHFPIFEKWEDVYISKDLLEWNNTKQNQIKTFFNTEKEYKYKIYLNENNAWVPKHFITIKTPKLGKYNKIYLKDIMSLDEALWTFGVIDYYLQCLGLKIDVRIMASV